MSCLFPNLNSFFLLCLHLCPSTIMAIMGYPLFSAWPRGRTTHPHRETMGAVEITEEGILAQEIVVVQIVMLGTSILFMRPLAYVVWIVSWATLWRVSNRLRAIAEHGGMVRSKDRRLTTHVVRQTRLARFWMVPYNTGWHLAHHVDMGVPWRNLPRLHDELVRSGWVTEEIVYPSYRAFWKAASSGTPPTSS